MEQDSSKQFLEKTLYGTKEVIMTWEDQIQEFKLNYVRAIHEFDNSLEPTETLSKISKFIEAVGDDPEITREHKSFESYLYHDGVPQLLKYLKKARSDNPEVGFG